MHVGLWARWGRGSAHGSGFGLLAILCFLPGCTTVGPDFETPEASTAQAWQEAGNNRIKSTSEDTTNWWKAFGDPVLDELVEKSYGENLSLQIAGIRVLETRARLGIAVGTLYPQRQGAVGGAVHSSLSENLTNTQVIDLTSTSYDLGFDAAWELDFWGKFRRGIESADAAFVASIASYDDLLVTLTAEVANVYVVIRGFEETLRIARENEAIQLRSVQIASARFRGGDTTELDVQQAQTQLYGTQARIPELEDGLRQAENALSVLLGMPPGQIRALLGGPAPIPNAGAEVAVGIPAELINRRPDVKRAELQAAAQSALIGVARADLFPSLSVFGTVGLAASSGTDTTASGSSGASELFDSDSVVFVGGPRFNWALLNYGRLKNNVRVQDARLQQLITNYQNTVLRAAEEAENAMSGFLRTQESAEFRVQSEQAARRAVELALIQYREGTIDFTTVLTTQASLLNQQEALASTQTSNARSLVALYKALGGGWQIRQGQDFVGAPIKEEMRQRTNWGGLLDPAATEEPAREDIGKKRRPDW